MARSYQQARKKKGGGGAGGRAGGRAGRGRGGGRGPPGGVSPASGRGGRGEGGGDVSLHPSCPPWIKKPRGVVVAPSSPPPPSAIPPPPPPSKPSQSSSAKRSSYLEIDDDLSSVPSKELYVRCVDPTVPRHERRRFLERLEESGCLERRLWPECLRSALATAASDAASSERTLEYELAYLTAAVVCARSDASGGVGEGRSPLSFATYVPPSFFERRGEGEGGAGGDAATGKGVASSPPSDLDETYHQIFAAAAETTTGTMSPKELQTKAFDLLLTTLLSRSSAPSSSADEGDVDFGRETTIVRFVTVALSSLDLGASSSSSSNVASSSSSRTKGIVSAAIQSLTSVSLWNKMPKRRRELELRRGSGKVRRDWSEITGRREDEGGKGGRGGAAYLTVVAETVLDVVEGTPFGSGNDKGGENDGDDDGDRRSESIAPAKAKRSEAEATRSYVLRSLELLIDLLSTPQTRGPYLKLYLDSVHFDVRCRLCSPAPHSRLFDRLSTKLSSLLRFPLDDFTHEPLSLSEYDKSYRARATALQKIAHRHYRNELPELVYAGVTLICDPKGLYLRKILTGLDDATLKSLCRRLRLIDGEKDGGSVPLPSRTKYTERELLTSMLVSRHATPPYPSETLRSFPLYPTETILWDADLIPPGNLAISNSESSSSAVLALPKINVGFLTYQDYLLRNFELNRLESAYEIRGDVVDVVRRMKPRRRGGYDHEAVTDSYIPAEEAPEEGDGFSRTEFAGWARMALKLRTSPRILRVARPNLGETCPSEVLAEICIDLRGLGESLRDEWDGVGEYDNLFLLGIDAQRMTGLPAPVMEAPRRSNKRQREGGAPSSSERRVPDEEDMTFPSRYGVMAVRGCCVVEVRDEADVVLSDPAAVSLAVEEMQEKTKAKKAALAKKKDKEGGGEAMDVEEEEQWKPKGTKRYLKVKLDPNQYAMDARAGNDAVYEMLNVVMRRHGRENNFKSILETVRGLLDGSGSVRRSVPPWLRTLLLGRDDDPSAASYDSDVMKQYAKTTAGVTPSDTALDYGDTFLDEHHLRESFPGREVVFLPEEGGTKAAAVVTAASSLAEGAAAEEAAAFVAAAAATPRPDRKKHRVRVVDNDNGRRSRVEATPYPFVPPVSGNPVRFTPVQVSAVRSGLSPGLTVIVGPPGTGKTDVAVQIIANLYHSFPTQRTVVVTHSNAALNDLFEKVMERGDVDERYLLRLGSGERDLRTTSEHDFTRAGRVAHTLRRRAVLLEEVQRLSESLGISGRAERGSDGSPSYTCETAGYFRSHHVRKRMKIFEGRVKERAGGSNKDEEKVDDVDAGDIFPFAKYFATEGKALTVTSARSLFAELSSIFDELAEYRPLELLRSQRQRTDYLLTKQARVVAMTCTHAAIVRSRLVDLGFRYDNVLMEESGQMTEIETFVPLLLQGAEADGTPSRLKRVCLIGDHHQLPPVVKNRSFSRFSNLDQSLFARLIRMGVPFVELNRQGRAREEIAMLYSWRYHDLGNLRHVVTSPKFQKANTGFAYTYQMINVEDFQGRGESTPTAYFYQNVGEAEYVVALFQYMVLIGYPPEKISILTTYNGQKELLFDVLSQRCGPGTPMDGVRPGSVSTVDHYQGQQNDYVLLSLVRTEAVGHLRDVRRLVVAVSRARLGLYAFCRRRLFGGCVELRRTMELFARRPDKLRLVTGEHYPTERSAGEDGVPKESVYDVEDVTRLGSIVHSMQEKLCSEM